MNPNVTPNQAYLAASEHAAERRHTLFRLRTDAIIDLSFFSVRPSEGECLLLPNTYLDLRSETSVTTVVDGLELPLRILETSPHLTMM